MAFLMISKSYSNIWMEQLFFCVFFTELLVLLTASTVFPKRDALYLNDLELSVLKSA